MDDLQFLVMVDGTSSADIARTLAEAGAVPQKENTLLLSGNLIDIRANEEADPSLVDGSEEEWLYYAWNVEVYPTEKTRTVEDQVHLARRIQEILTSEGMAVEIAATFEALL